MLTLHKLQQTLIKFMLYKERVGDIVELARYSYANMPERSGGVVGGSDGLRELVVEYVACEVENLVESESFLGLVEEGGALARDVMRGVVRRID